MENTIFPPKKTSMDETEKNINIQNKKRKWKPFQFLSHLERKRIQMKEKEKIKNVLFNHHLFQDFRLKSKYYKNLDFDTKFLNVINKPKTPHNTGQYITHIFSSKQKKYDYINEDNLEDVCSYGSMMNNDDIEMIDLDGGIEPFSIQRKRFMSCDLQERESHGNFINNQKDLNIDNQDLGFKKYSSSIFEENNEFQFNHQNVQKISLML